MQPGDKNGGANISHPPIHLFSAWTGVANSLPTNQSRLAARNVFLGNYGDEEQVNSRLWGGGTAFHHVERREEHRV